SRRRSSPASGVQGRPLMKLRTAITLLIVVGILGGLAYGALRLIRATSTEASVELPTTHVKRGKVVLTVAARGELQGGNSEMLTAPTTGGGDRATTYPRDPGQRAARAATAAQLTIT